MIHRTRRCAVALAAILVCAHAMAKPPRPDHPLIGAWEVTLPDGLCTETYIVRKDGTTLVTSAEEVAESEYELTDQPSEKGFYKWVDKLVKDNGKKDCSGEITEPGRQVTNYILLHPSNDIFLMCGAQDIQTCFGPFRRIKGGDA